MTAPAGIAPSDVRWGPDGLVPAVVQDASDGRVLMVAWVHAEALAATLTTGQVHFHSRSRGRLWRKGETSGNVLHLRDIALDCDGDALLLAVEPAGPTCHRGTRSCFDTVGAAPDTTAPDTTAPEPATLGPVDQGSPSQDFAWLETLWATIADRARLRPQGSYTASLLAAGVDAAARKVTEEATEVLIAAKDDAIAEAAASDRVHSRERLADELADLLYHALVVLAERGVAPADVIGVLRSRRSAG